MQPVINMTLSIPVSAAPLGTPLSCMFCRQDLSDQDSGMGANL
jgi:hypothetical protein